MGLFDEPEARLGVALGIGLLLGTDRERRKGKGPHRGAAGVRTFALVALLGGVAQRLGGEWPVVAGAVFVGAAALVAYAINERTDPGITSEVAIVLTYALGAFAQVEPRIAAATGIVAGVILAFRTAIHRLVRERVTDPELLDALLLAAAAMVVLPLTPNHAIDPLGVVNPFRVWRLVVIFMAVGFAGHLAHRIVGAHVGLAIAGLASGFVSSVATIASMGQRATAKPAILDAAAAGAAASSVSTFAFLAILIGTANGSLLAHVAAPLAAAGVVAAIYAAALAWRGARNSASTEKPEGHAFRISTAIGFALLVAGVTFLSTWIAQRFGDASVVVASGLAAFADAHAASASVASVSAAGRIGDGLATLGVLVAITTNTATKAFFAFSSGPRAFARRVALGLALVLVALWGAWIVGALAG